MRLLWLTLLIQVMLLLRLTLLIQVMLLLRLTLLIQVMLLLRLTLLWGSCLWDAFCALCMGGCGSAERAFAIRGDPYASE